MKYTIYDPGTGEIQCVITVTDPAQRDRYLQGRAWIPGDYDSRAWQIVHGEPQPLPAPPHQPGCRYQWDAQGQTWQLDLRSSAWGVRKIRNQRLKRLDSVNPVWWSTLSSDQQAELAVYRQALLAVPQQPGFPAQVEWPQPPVWLG